ncbi:hypothetical protein FPANT_11800 [Fusarium pseudoanthophilum]|uniref:Uncharacterized protein n=1 Tax=Fusarium pseudoanthophilum TaxID=48495 RepID=A0A8H5KJE2_9HYPO|nr:hypothetical protein FPANT_11800 [Fusarium pseudoanthophilum]
MIKLFEEKDIHNVTKSTTDDWDDWDESDDDTDSGCSVDEDVASWDISTSRNSTSDASDNDIPSSLSSDSAFEVATQRDRSGAAITEATSTDEEPIDEPVQTTSSPDLHLSERPVLEEFLIDHASPYSGFAHGSENCQVSTEMDYLLIPTNTALQTEACTSKSAELIQISEAFDLQDKTEPQPVIIATALLGYVEGVVFPASSLLRPPGSKTFQTLYCIESDSAMPKGTSGSPVFDRQTGLLVGYIVLGCPEKNIWYMVPILDVLNDLKVRFRQKGKCQTRLDVDATIRLSDQRGFLNEMPPGLLGANQVCQGGSSILMTGENDQSMVPKSSKMNKLGVFDKHSTGVAKGSQKERPAYSMDNLSPSYPDDTNDKLTCLYVKNPDPTAIMALLETTSLPMKGFQEILYNSIVTQPRAIIDLHEYGSDTRSVFAGTAFQSKSNLSSLKTEDRLGATQDEISSSHTDKDHPYTSICTVMITGVSDRYWTAVCLDDDFFDLEERPEISEDIIPVGSSSEDQAVEVKRPASPRAYALQELAGSLERISEHHARAHLRLDTELRSLINLSISCSAIYVFLKKMSRGIHCGKAFFKNLAFLSHYIDFEIFSPSLAMTTLDSKSSRQ